MPDWSQPFIIDMDASDVGIGAVLSQVDQEGIEHVIAYGSHVLSKAERNYCVTRKELLAVVTFLQHFRQYLLSQPFTIRTDHGALIWLQEFRNPEGQLVRWLEKLQEYQFTIVHRPGKKHANADALSRLPCQQCGRASHYDSTPIALLTSGDLLCGYSPDQLRDTIARQLHRTSSEVEGEWEATCCRLHENSACATPSSHTTMGPVGC